MKYQRKNQCMWCKLGEEVVVLEPESGIYLGLNPVAASIWNFLGEPRTHSQIVDLVLSEFQVDSNVAEVDIKDALEDFARQNLITQIDI